MLAAAVKLLETTLIRVGNDEYARDNNSFGLTTMRDEHVKVRGATIRFDFRGKSGIEHEIDLKDRRLATIVTAAAICLARSCSNTSTRRARSAMSARAT